MKVFYHSADFDGMCSAAIIALRNARTPNFKVYPVNYGDSVPFDIIEPNELVAVVDFSFPIDQMKALNEKAKLLWIDHHKTAIEAAENANFIAAEQLTRIGDAGCELTWEFFEHNQDMPWAVSLLGRYDVWQWKDVHGAIEFQYGLRIISELLRPNNETDEWKFLWHKLFTDEDFVEEHILKGRTIYEFVKQENKKYCKSCAFETTILGVPCIAVNKGLSNSQLFDDYENGQDNPVMLTFVYRHDMWHCSIYSTKSSIDVSAIAKQFGGGGHRGAAGFSCKEFNFLGT